MGEFRPGRMPNTAFLTSSEYSLDECLGQPQTLVRHPDMPKKTFADLWRTIREGRARTSRRPSPGAVHSIW